MRISEGARRLNLNIADKGAGNYELVELFTTQDGQWEPSGKPFSVPQWALSYLPGFSSAGAATHAFVRVEDEQRKPLKTIVRFGSVPVATASKPEMWAIQQVSGSYKPDLGEHGAMTIDFAEAKHKIEGVGLPWNNHVSLFAVYRQIAEQPKPPVVVPHPPSQPGVITVSIDAVIEVEQLLQKLQKAVDKLR